MLTDWVLIRRLAYEIDGRYRGAKVTDVGMLPDRRTAIALWSRGDSVLLCIDIFGSPPLITIEDGDLPIAAEPGFVRALGSALRQTVLLACRARKGDRLLRLTFGARSRFGVGDEVEVFVELVPRFGNIVLVKRDTVIAAAKEFTLADNGTRAVAAGLAYQPPPERSEMSLVPKLVAENCGNDPPEDRNVLLAFFDGDSAMRDPLYVYRRTGMPVQAHVVELPQLQDATLTREPSLLDVLREARELRIGTGSRERTTARRDALRKRILDRERKVVAEMRAVEGKRRTAATRESLRAQGEAIYTTLHESSGVERDIAKDRAAKLFAEYKRLGTMLPHLEQREAYLRNQQRSIDALRWEIDRAADEDINDVANAVADLEPHRSTTAKPARKRKRAPLEIRTPSGSRIQIGRSPLENAELTFRIAGPNDWWFHAQGIPGAHVILRRDDRTEPPDEDMLAAASLAAFHSKGKAGTKLPVDYTQRKHVRKQKDAPPGLVWYTDFKTFVVEPKEPASTPDQSGSAPRDS